MVYNDYMLSLTIYFKWKKWGEYMQNFKLFSVNFTGDGIINIILRLLYI